MNLPMPSLGFLTAAEAEAPRFVYALGHIEPRFPNATVAAGVVDALRRTKDEKLNGQQTLSLLSEGENRHLLRQVCWVLMSQGAPRYLLQLASVADFDALIDRFRATRRSTEVDVVIGRCTVLAVPYTPRSLLTSISIRLPEHGGRRLVHVGFAYARRRTESHEHYLRRLHLTYAVPCLERPLAPYYDQCLEVFRPLHGFRSWA